MLKKKVKNINLRDATLDNASFAGIAGATYRNIPFNMEYRVVDDGDGGEKRKDLVGYSAVFNKEFKTEFYSWTFIEKIASGAFANALTKSDTRALFNHDANFVLGRNTSGTLRMSEDKRGLAIEVDLPDTQLVRDLVSAPMKRGDITQMSFAFTVTVQEWRFFDDKPDERDIKEVKLFDVSPVTFPALEGTDVALASRSASKEIHIKSSLPSGQVQTRLKKLNLLAKEVTL